MGEMIRGAVLANEGKLFRGDGEWKVEGDPIDVGFLALAYKAGEIPEEIRRTFRVTRRIPYESERKLAGAFYENRDGQSRVAVKGAAEAILPRCSSMLYPDREITIDPQGIREEAEQLARQGYRVLAVASGEGSALEESGEEISEEALPAMKFLGLAGFIDPLRPEVKDAVDECREAGVRVAMITGDHPDTALAIARNLGMAESRDNLLTGAELKHLEREGKLLEEKVEQVFGVCPYEPHGEVTVFFENFHTFNCRSEEASAFQVPWRSNLFLIIAIPAALGIHVLSLYLPFLRRVLGTEPVSLSAALILSVCASTVLISSEIFKHMKAFAQPTGFNT